jgi:uncharacterized protein
MVAVSREWREIPGRYNLLGCKCGVCGKVYFPKRGMCPVCRRASVGKIEDYHIARTGAVYTFSIIHEAPDCNNNLKPYAVGMIKTDDGVMIEGQITGVDLDKIEIGMKVRATLRKLDSDGPAGVIHYGYKFVPQD